MKDNPSITDQAIFTLGEIERMCDGIDDNNPYASQVPHKKR